MAMYALWKCLEERQFYYWLSFTINFVVPFVSLLVMNSVIINTLRKRSRFIDTNSTEEGQGKDKVKVKFQEVRRNKFTQFYFW